MECGTLYVPLMLTAFRFVFLQLVWGESNLIGCGFAYYQDSRRYNKLYVCNYGPG